MKKVLVVLAASALLLAPAASSVSAASSSTASASANRVIRFINPKKKIRVAKKFKAKFVCSVDCKVKAIATLTYPDAASIKVSPVSGSILAHQVAWEYVTLNNAARNHLKATVGGSRLKVVVTAKALDGTKRVQTIRHAFKFRK